MIDTLGHKLERDYIKIKNQNYIHTKKAHLHSWNWDSFLLSWNLLLYRMGLIAQLITSVNHHFTEDKLDLVYFVFLETCPPSLLAVGIISFIFSYQRNSYWLLFARKAQSSYWNYLHESHYNFIISEERAQIVRFCSLVPKSNSDP